MEGIVHNGEDCYNSNKTELMYYEYFKVGK